MYPTTILISAGSALLHFMSTTSIVQANPNSLPMNLEGFKQLASNQLALIIENESSRKSYDEMKKNVDNRERAIIDLLNEYGMPIKIFGFLEVSLISSNYDPKTSTDIHVQTIMCKQSELLVMYSEWTKRIELIILDSSKNPQNL